MTSVTTGVENATADDQDHKGNVAARDLLLYALTFVAGSMDAISFIGLGQVFTANMTGNTVLMAIAVGSGKFLAASRSVVALLGFAAGAMLAGRMVDPGRHKILWSKSVTRVLFVEFAIAVVFALAWFFNHGSDNQLDIQGLIVLSALSMGLQSGAARRLSVSGVSTVVVTSMLTSLMAELAALGAASPNRVRWTMVFVSLFAGAAASGVLLVTVRILAPVLPAAVLCLICIAAIRKFHNSLP
ncbi:MAG: DUF1275 family protein [Thermoplasmata archaeon]|nr:DUF1275 family protein [Candidatus Sysuiplasma acidicola]MBX8646755.1 DUF1275 family protein [Candidatus Sysuiplasma acidicola]MDH2905971.1 YoaK family protein [Methanomassiliicoccales archaeon]